MNCFVCKKDHKNSFEVLIGGEFKKICWFCLNRECICGSFFFKRKGQDEICLGCGKKFDNEEITFNPS